MNATLPLNASLPLTVNDLTVAWHRKPVIWDVDLEVQPGQLVGVVGPNGAGKSTLLKAIMDIYRVRKIETYSNQGSILGIERFAKPQESPKK